MSELEVNWTVSGTSFITVDEEELASVMVEGSLKNRLAALDRGKYKGGLLRGIVEDFSERDAPEIDTVWYA